jgi:DNA-binding CsgD family transcriptional regulator
VPTCWGLIRVAAHARTGADEFAITLQLFLPRAVRRLKALGKLDLSPRERELALAMSGPASGSDLARSSGLSTGAYRQYAKRIYARLGVDGRDGVRLLLDT